MIRSDFHMHTAFSGDCKASAREMIEGALKKGMRTICITDHNDKDYPIQEDDTEEDFVFDVEEYFRILRELQQEYAGRIEIRIGIELGLQPHLGEYYEKLVNSYPFDFVLGSVHVVNGSDPYYGEIFRGQTDREAYEQTFITTLKNIEMVKDFDVLGHLDYVVRYGTYGIQEYSYRRFAEYIDEILRKIIAQGKGLEMNMAGMKYGLGFAHPHPDILKRYKELGGEIVTIGADAHCPEHIAYDFRKAGAILKACGFEYYTEFKERMPIFKHVP